MLAQPLTDREWTFFRMETPVEDSGRYMAMLKVWQQLYGEDMRTILEDMQLTLEQDNPNQTLVLFMRDDAKKLCVAAKYVTGGADANVCWLSAFVVAPHSRRKGFGRYFINLLRTRILVAYPNVTRISLMPLDESKSFWRKVGFKPMHKQATTLLADVLPALKNTPFADAPLQTDLEIWKWEKPQ